MFSVTWILIYYPEWERGAISHRRLKGNFQWSPVCDPCQRPPSRNPLWMWKSPSKCVMVGTVRSTPLKIIPRFYHSTNYLVSIFHIPCWFASKCIHISYLRILYSLFCCCVEPLNYVRFFCNPMDWSPSSSPVHKISQARILEWVAISFSRGSSQPKDQTHISCVSCTDKQILYHWTTREAPFIILNNVNWDILNKIGFLWQIQFSYSSTIKGNPTGL